MRNHLPISQQNIGRTPRGNRDPQHNQRTLLVAWNVKFHQELC